MKKEEAKPIIHTHKIHMAHNTIKSTGESKKEVISFCAG